MNTSLIIILICAAVVAGVVGYTLWRGHQIRQNGTDADAFVTRIDRVESTDSDGSVSVSHRYYVRYHDADGVQQEARLTNPKKGLKVGSRLKIRYLPEKPMFAVMMGDGAVKVI